MPSSSEPGYDLHTDIVWDWLHWGFPWAVWQNAGQKCSRKCRLGKGCLRHWPETFFKEIFSSIVTNKIVWTTSEQLTVRWSSAVKSLKLFTVLLIKIGLTWTAPSIVQLEESPQLQQFNLCTTISGKIWILILTGHLHTYRKTTHYCIGLFKEVYITYIFYYLHLLKSYSMKARGKINIHNFWFDFLR